MRVVVHGCNIWAREVDFIEALDQPEFDVVLSANDRAKAMRDWEIEHVQSAILKLRQVYDIRLAVRDREAVNGGWAPLFIRFFPEIAPYSYSCLMLLWWPRTGWQIIDDSNDEAKLRQRLAVRSSSSD